MDVKKILIPTDFSECSNAALNHALFLAEHLDADLDILHVVVLHDLDTAGERFPDADEINLRLRDLATGEMKTLLEDLGPIAQEIVGDGVEHTIAVREGHPAGQIVDHADDVDADLIVIATHGRTGLDRFFLGSVAERVVRGAACPVLTLKVEIEG